MIKVYNRTREDHSSHPNNFRIFRPFILGNPYTHVKNKDTLAMYLVGSREEAVEAYSRYFDMMYGSNIRFTKVVDLIYEHYKNGEDVYLECYCNAESEPCHGNVIIDKLRKKLLMDKIKKENGKEETIQQQ